MRRILTVCGAVMVLGLSAACGGEGDPGPSSPEDTETIETPTVESPFAQAVSRISPDALGEQPHLEFGQTKALLELSDSDERWTSITPVGNMSLTNIHWQASTGIDAAAADYGIEVGVPPKRVGIVAGGQDADQITEAATQAGYEGTDVLTQDLNPSVPATISIQQIKPVDDDVIVATTDADVGWVDGGSLFADEQVGPVAVCLGDVLGATIAEINGELVGVGVRADGSAIQSVLCLPSGDDRADAVETDLKGPNYADRVELVDTEDVEGLVKVTVQHTAAGEAALMFIALQQQDVPGI